MIVRLDDFPTGVRPILKDLSLFFKIFDEFEKRKIVFYVGIVPKLLEKYVLPKDIQKLKNYKYLIVCQHGYNHRYDEFSKVLIDKNDIKNNGTVGVFNEFENYTKQQILNFWTKLYGKTTTGVNFVLSVKKILYKDSKLKKQIEIKFANVKADT